MRPRRLNLLEALFPCSEVVGYEEGYSSSKHPLPTDVDTPAVLELRPIERLNDWYATFNK